MVKVPLPVTLKKYGLTAEEWLELYNKQGGVCFVCQKLPKSGRLNIDHFHVPKYKKLPPEERKKFVRALVCYWCNKSYLGRGITIEKSKRVTQLLEEFKERIR